MKVASTYAGVVRARSVARRSEAGLTGRLLSNPAVLAFSGRVG
jgi:hypothetical protein